MAIHGSCRTGFMPCPSVAPGTPAMKGEWATSMASRMPCARHQHAMAGASRSRAVRERNTPAHPPTNAHSRNEPSGPAQNAEKTYSVGRSREVKALT